MLNKEHKYTFRADPKLKALLESAKELEQISMSQLIRKAVEGQYAYKVFQESHRV